MTWEAVTAIATLASTLVVAVAAIAAVVQIRHLRRGNQLEAVLNIYATFNSREMVEARRFCIYEFGTTLHGPDGRIVLPDMRTLDERVTMVANFHNAVGALVVDKFLDERLIWPLTSVVQAAWNALAPLATAVRKQRGDPIWGDFEYLAAIREGMDREAYIRRYPRWFQLRFRAEMSTLESTPPAS